VTYNGDITQSNNATTVSITGGHDGSVTFDNGTIEATDGDGLQFSNADGTYAFNGTNTLDGGDAGIDILGGSDGTFTFSATSSITNPTGDAFVVNGGTATITYNGTIDNDAGNSVDIQSITDGAISFNGNINDTGAGIFLSNNSGGTISFNGINTLDTDANDAFTATNNTGATINVAGLDIDTTSGTGFVATGGGTINVTGGTNTVDTTTGVGVSMSGVTIGDDGINLQSVSVDGATNGIVLTNVDGGTFSIGANGANLGDGGTIQNTTGAAVLLTNTSDVSISFLSIINAGTGGDDAVRIVHNDGENMSVIFDGLNANGAGDQGIDVSATGAATFTFKLLDSIVNTPTNEAVAIDVGDANQVSNITIQGSTLFASDDESLLIEVDGGGVKTMNLLVDD
ncbi:MAG: hypothetical protein MI757_11280, partial [Pirellulales bacterium]|nr:hypothetical protein [Pirellulales bacterium]